MISEKVTMSRVGELRRRHSSANESSGNIEEKVVPHYLRASIRSCHDFCKYGNQLELEPKKTRLIPAERTQLHRGSEKKISEVVAAITPGVKRRASIDSLPTKMALVNRIESTDSNVSDTITTIKTEPGRPVQPDNDVLANKSKTSLIKVKQSPLLLKSKFSYAFKTKRQEVSSSSKKDITPKPISKRVEASPPSSSKKEEALLKSIFQKAKIHPMQTSYMAKTPSKSSFKKTRTSSKLSENHATGTLPLLLSSTSKSSHKRVVSINMHKSLKTASHVKNQPKPRKVVHEEHCIKDEVEAEEKTLYVIEIENKDNTFQSNQNENQDIELSRCQSFSSSKFSSQEEDQGESEYVSNKKVNEESSKTLELNFKENEKPQKQKDEIVILVETQIQKSGTKKLKFKRGKVLRENDVDSDNEGKDVTGREKVVLRHQDMKGKKDEQMLLNNVIEETTSKLVEIQRSKVKALVGAFETLISLNEKKP